MKKRASKRELIAPRGDERYIRRDDKGRIKESDDESRDRAEGKEACGDEVAAQPKPERERVQNREHERCPQNEPGRSVLTRLNR